MRIIECCPFYNENLIANIHINESLKWIDEFHVTEANYSFKMSPKEYNFNLDQKSPKVFYHQLDGEKLFKKNRRFIPYIDTRPITKWYPKIYKRTPWYNDAVQRNYSLWNANVDDDDIVILSDIDEIIDSKYADIIIHEVKKRGIVTIKIHFTLFYFNLFCSGWLGPEDYSYRIFILRGDILKKRFFHDSDFLRKEGERGLITDEVYCFPEIMGFHHSWLGDEHFVLNKLNSYAHSDEEHSSSIKTDGKYDIDLLREHIKEGKTIFDGSTLSINDSIQLISSVDKLKETNPEYFFKL